MCSNLMLCLDLMVSWFGLNFLNFMLMLSISSEVIRNYVVRHYIVPCCAITSALFLQSKINLLSL